MKLDCADKIALSLIGLVLLVLLIGCYYAIEEQYHPERYRYELKYQDKIVKCIPEFPKHMEGKMSFWYGTVNLLNCEDGKEYLGVTNVEVIKRPRCH